MTTPQRVVVLRALMLGDLLCAVPALRAMRRAWPQAHIALLGLPVARELATRLEAVDEWLPFPGWPGLPEQPVDIAALPGFLADMQARRWDLAVQLHGSGPLTNPLVALLGATHCAGFAGPGAHVPDATRFCAWPTEGREAQRLLALCRHLGLPADDETLDFPLRPGDDAALHQAWPGWAHAGGYACIHVGSQLPSRRWPLERFAAVAHTLHEAGLTLVLTGTAGERALTAELAARLQAHGLGCLDLTGRTSLWSLGALLRRARLLLCNDTGVSHIAAALRVPSVVVSCGSDWARWAPADARLHRVLARPAPCRPCALAECPHDHACALALGVADVQAAVRQQLALTEDIPCPAACAS